MSKKVLELQSKKAPKVKITNFMIERFQRDESFAKLRRAIGLGAAHKYKIFKVAENMMNGPEARALNKAKDELIKSISDKEQLSYNHPKVKELMELESGLELEKLILQASKLPADFTPEDMIITSWLVEYVDDTKENKT